MSFKRRFRAYRRRSPRFQFVLCMFGLHLWESGVLIDWCTCCLTSRDLAR